ncbi:cupin domain-containing protein [Aurantivibrio plasticivorans]
MISDVGARMLVLRKLNGWSQRQLAKRAGVPHSAISMIEHGQVSPSVNSLKKVLDGVPISLADFFALDLNMQIRVFYKEKDIEEVGIGSMVRAAIQSKGEEPVELVRETYPAGSDTGDELLVDSGEMMGYVVSGEIEVTIGGEVDKLKPGDGFYFERRRPHRFRNLGENPAELIAALLPPKAKQPYIG